MAFLSSNQIGIKRTTVRVNIPNNSYSKLKYYLSCVASSFEILDELANYTTDYKNTNSLTLSEKKNIVKLCNLFNPNELIRKCWFQNEEMDSINEFFELSHVRNSLVVSQNILIGAHNRRVVNVMFFKNSWMDAFYFKPISLVTQEIKNEGYFLNFY